MNIIDRMKGWFQRDVRGNCSFCSTLGEELCIPCSLPRYVAECIDEHYNGPWFGWVDKDGFIRREAVAFQVALLLMARHPEYSEVLVKQTVDFTNRARQRRRYYGDLRRIVDSIPQEFSEEQLAQVTGDVGSWPDGVKYPAM